MDIPTWMSVGGAFLLIIGVIFILLATVSRFYKKISPNTVAVITGRKNKVKTIVYEKSIGTRVEKQLVDGVETDVNVEFETEKPVERFVEKGYRFIVGGGALIVPLVEKMEQMALNVIPIEVTVTDAPSKDGVKVTVMAIANVKISSDASSLPLAIERFLGKSDAEIKGVSSSTLEGNLRAIVGTMTVEELVNDRTKFTQEVLAEAGTDLAKMGLGADVVKIQSITDEHGYIDALGKKRTAEVVRDASIGEAEAQRDSAIKTAAARQQGEVATAKAEQAISDADRDRDTTIADNEAKVAAQRAQIPIAAAIAEATRTQDLKVATVDAEKAEARAQIELEDVRAQRNAAELNATVVVRAEKEREATVIGADAERQAAELEGEAFRLKADKEGKGEQAKQEGIAAGRKALASADQAEQEAQAAGNKAKLVAAAAGVQADLEAKAAGELALAEALRARLLAEAEGTLKKAEAFRALDEAGRFLMILEALPPVIAAFGAAGEQILKPVAEAIGQGLGNIDEVRIVDLGGGQGGGAGKSLLSQFAGTPVEAMFGLWEKAKAAGLEPLARALAEKYGIDIDKIVPKEPVIDGTAKDLTKGPDAPAPAAPAEN